MKRQIAPGVVTVIATAEAAVAVAAANVPDRAAKAVVVVVDALRVIVASVAALGVPEVAVLKGNAAAKGKALAKAAEISAAVVTGTEIASTRVRSLPRSLQA